MSLLLFDLAEVNRDQLTSCELKLAALESWLKNLPLAHPEGSCQALSQFLEEFNQLKFLPLRRLEWLNLIQPLVHQVTQGLDTGSHFEQEGDLAQNLQNLLAQGYKRVVNDLLKLRDQLPPPILARSLLQALYNALKESSALILRSCLLSVNAPANTWQELNLLYHLACQSRLQHKNLTTNSPKNCEEAYFQVVLLALIQAETLRSDEVTLVYPLLAEAAALLNRLAEDNPNQLFIISAEHQYIPQRSGLDAQNAKPTPPQKNTHPKGRGLSLDTRILIDALNTHLAKSQLSKRLSQHLAACLGEANDRITPRIETNDPIELVLGLRSVHFHMNNKRPLESLVAGGNLNEKPKDNPFITASQDDPWSAAFDAGENTSNGHIQLVEMQTNLSTSLDEELNKRHPIYSLTQVNASATGYCIFWQGEEVPLLKTGELVAFREAVSDPWQAGLIRWVKDVQQGLQMGIERLGGRMQPCAVKPIIKIGEQRDFMPGFLIPELQVLGIPAGLITPLLPFREGQKVEISYSQGVEKAKLFKLVSSPGAFNQFELEPLGVKGLSLH
ncbi:hypothetical protein [Marinospirillum insulare]|uniref:Molecular chaperone n=1 Tax=Marinospirillum insulare TaxID=217169 RepID=A0ABQ5ZVF0_9GAMM|nr:hypothetical protein [Marinospirillum insulare]GLR63407.1 hypothetical protein GCM10007878_08420 [Marinospirillum insulare]